MAEPRGQISALEAAISGLNPEDQIELFRRVLTPEMELRLLVQELGRETREWDAAVIDAEVDQAVLEVRSRCRPTP